MAISAFRMLAIAQLHESKLNPRKSFDKDRLAELAASIKSKGVVQPIVVRPNATGFEIVCGARRYRAAKLAELEEMPAIVRELTDAEFLEVAVIENLQRDDVHPLEEAEGYEQLMKLPGYTVDDLAHKVGKSKAYIYGRMKLCALGPVGREKLYAGELDASTALLIARIPGNDLQADAIEKLLEAREYGEIKSYREAADFIQADYMLRLKDAPFDVKAIYFHATNAEPIATACGDCPKRTGNQPELFADVKGADVCTDPACFKAKREAHSAVLVDKAKAAGKTVISGKAAKKAMPHESGQLYGYQRPSDPCSQDSKLRPLHEIFGDKLQPLQLLQNPHTGDVFEVIAHDDLQSLIEARFPKVSKAARSTSAPSGNDQYNRDQKAKEEKARRETQIRARVFEAVSTAHTGVMTPIDAVVIAQAMWQRTDHEGTKRILQLRDPAARAKDAEIWKLSKAFAKTIDTFDPAELVRLMVQMALVSEIHVGMYSPQPSEALFATATRLKVDVNAIRTELSGAKKATKPAVKKRAARKSSK